jgi:hypothetical protein
MSIGEQSGGSKAALVMSWQRANVAIDSSDGHRTWHERETLVAANPAEWMRSFVFSCGNWKSDDSRVR